MNAHVHTCNLMPVQQIKVIKMTFYKTEKLLAVFHQKQKPKIINILQVIQTHLTQRVCEHGTHTQFAFLHDLAHVKNVYNNMSVGKNLGLC